MRAARAHLATDTHTHRAFFLYAFAAFIPLGVVVVVGENKKKQTNVRNSASVFEGYARRAHNAWPLIWTKSILWKKKKASQQTMHFICMMMMWVRACTALHCGMATMQPNPPTQEQTDVETNEACNQSTPWCRLAQFDFDVCFYSFC